MEGEESDSKVTIHSWRKSLRDLVWKLKTRRCWVAVMFILGTADMTMNLTNFVYLSNDHLNYGLVIGPPSRDLWISICVFTIIGTLFYLPETVNTLSALFDANGDTVVPIHLELSITLTFEHIPLAIVDYFVARCRRQFTTKTASWCHIVRLVFIFVRIIWYAQIEGKKLRKNDKYQIKQVLVLFCCLLYSVSIAFNIMNWYNEPDTVVKSYHLSNVSTFLLKYPSPPEQLHFNINVTEDLRRQSGKNLSNAWLANSLIDFFISNGNLNFNRSILSRYQCNVSEEHPAECDEAKWLGFRFIYSLSDWSPYGEIRFNFARICPREVKKKCVDSKEVLKGKWKLFFYEATKTMKSDNITVTSVILSAPFRKAYTHPRPMYSPQVSVCTVINLEEFDCE